MKKALLIFGILAIISAIAFGWSVAAFGVKDNNYSFSIAGISLPRFSVGNFRIGTNQITFIDYDAKSVTNTEANQTYFKEFKSGIPKDIKIDVVSAMTEIVVGDVPYATVEYRTANSASFGLTAEFDGTTLKVSEENNIWGNALNFFSVPQQLKVTLPEKAYGDIKVSAMSGDMKIDGTESEFFTAEMMSGSGDYAVFAKSIKVDMMSGNLKMQNCTDKRPEKLEVSTLSGSADISGFPALNNTVLNSTSGRMTVSDLSGNVSFDSTSGSSKLSFAEWSGDLSIDKTSGSTDIELPADSGINLDLNRVSGSVTVTYGQSKTTFSESTKSAAGGSNRHNVSVDITSGSVNFYIHE